ncbi:MAG: alpha amylase catalytic region [Cohnella sp.]|nr:alpha amylase catalytic region [Cohnella sp.]
MDESRQFARDGIVCMFDGRTGQLMSVRYGETALWQGSLSVDIGCDGEYVAGRLVYHSFEGANTWELPRIEPEPAAGNSRREWGFAGFEEIDGVLSTRYQLRDLQLEIRYRLVDGSLEVTAVIEAQGSSSRHLNGVAFMASQPVLETLAFDFPGNVPYPEFLVAQLSDGEVVSTGLVNPVIRLRSEGQNVNLIFIDEEEKWGTGVYKTGNTFHMINLAALEADLEPGQPLTVGVLYIQALGDADPFIPIRRLYERKGWLPPADGFRDGVLYSCHPHGTMDSGFPIRRDLFEYAQEMQGLREMGIDHVWVLPIFEHLDRGVYHPTDQKIVDPRYGGDEAVRAFSRRIHELGMTLLFDYVPHGPELEDPLGRTHRHWASLRRDGEPQSEWNCLSFDMTHPDYLQYTKDLVKEHVERFGVDGARIDCAMGGLTNWHPYGDNRPSNSNLKGGIEISKAIRDGFVEAGKKPLVTPENFNPVPAYAPYTDVFYDMALYRVLFEMDAAALTPEAYARELTRWLEAEMLSTVPGYVKLRFLGNHDTVTWVWTKARATNVHGVGKAKALWVVLSCIDGMPMIYQGDEDTSIYRGDGPDLREFFRGLFAVRKQYLDNDYSTEYVYTGTPVMAFYRRNGHEARLVAVNLSPEPATFEPDADVSQAQLLLGGGTESASGIGVTLGGYGYAVWRLA